MEIKFEKLQFKKNWNNASDFPTFEDDESKVRADMQELHDETMEFINETLIPLIENMAVPGTGDMLESIYDPERKRENVYAYMDQKLADVTPEDIGAVTSEALQSHIDNQNNPHNVTAEQIANTTGLDALAMALGAAKIQTGSYVGTGTYGEGNETVLVLPFEPKLLLFTFNSGVSDYSTSYVGVWACGSPRMTVFMVPGKTTTSVTGCISTTVTVSGNTIQLCGKGSIYQFNSSSYTTYWVAIG